MSAAGKELEEKAPPEVGAFFLEESFSNIGKMMLTDPILCLIRYIMLNTIEYKRRHDEKAPKRASASALKSPILLLGN